MSGKNRFFRLFTGVLLLFLLAGCATYRTPGAGIHLGDLSRADEDIAEIIQREPTAAFPARIALARIQSTGYYSYNNQCYGQGAFCVVTTRDIESEQDLERLGRLPMISAIATMGQILLPGQLESIKDLRLAAARLRADMLLVYSIDTRFNIESTDIGPLALISLGFLPNKEAFVATTASMALFDVRTGFVYGVAESTATERQRATLWSSDEAVENSRLKTEAKSFQQLLGEFEKLWKDIVARRSEYRQQSTEQGR